MNPLKLALKYDPPTLALMYTLRGAPKKFLHEFHFEEDDLLATPEEVYENFQHLHPGYLDKINPQQVLRLIEKVQGEWVEEDADMGQAQQMQEYLRDIRSRMTEEEYEDFIAKVESGELVIGNQEEYDEEGFEDEDQDNDRF